MMLNKFRGADMLVFSQHLRRSPDSQTLNHTGIGSVFSTIGELQVPVHSWVVATSNSFCNKSTLRTQHSYSHATRDSLEVYICDVILWFNMF